MSANPQVATGAGEAMLALAHGGFSPHVSDVDFGGMGEIERANAFGQWRARLG